MGPSEVPLGPSEVPLGHRTRTGAWIGTLLRSDYFVAEQKIAPARVCGLKLKGGDKKKK